MLEIDQSALRPRLAGTLTDQSIADAVQRPQVELVGGLGRDGWVFVAPDRPLTIPLDQ
jgi:hypothetical protein